VRLSGGLPENDNRFVVVMACVLLSKAYGEVIVLQVCSPLRRRQRHPRIASVDAVLGGAPSEHHAAAL
jgi:hypothetical protein